jgi:transposase
MTCYQNRAYPMDLSDEQWAVLQPILPSTVGRGCPRKLDLRQVINAMLYVVVGGIQWRRLPHEFPPWYPRGFTMPATSASCTPIASD